MSNCMRQLLPCIALSIASAMACAEKTIVIVEGLGGEPRFVQGFAEQVDAIETASGKLVPPEQLQVFRNADAQRDAIMAYFETLAAESSPGDELLLYLVGHGSYDDHHYKFNLAGPDLTGEDIAGLLDAQAANVQVFVNTGSASGALGEMLERDGRILLLATRSGRERHATRFGTYLADAFVNEFADTNKNASVSAGEAFRFAERQVADFYERHNQLATEHPQLIGAMADRVVLARFTSAADATTDDALAALLVERQTMNADIEALRLRRETMAADDYHAALLEKMLALAMLEDRIEAQQEALQNAR
ncbi:MAG: hypothetical protein OEM85_00225 [Gammaproteobacteria bacterium]|nr:hypothetical protein [Gammaproteobacteria bacterium]